MGRMNYLISASYQGNPVLDLFLLLQREMMFRAVVFGFVFEEEVDYIEIDGVMGDGFGLDNIAGAWFFNADSDGDGYLRQMVIVMMKMHSYTWNDRRLQQWY